MRGIVKLLDFCVFVLAGIYGNVGAMLASGTYLGPEPATQKSVGMGYVLLFVAFCFVAWLMSNKEAQEP